MAKGTNEKPNAAAAFLGRKRQTGESGIVPPNGFEQVGDGAGEDGGTNGADARPIDAGTIDPTSIRSETRRRPGRPRLSDEQKTAAREARAGKEKVVIGEEPPDPSIVGFATQGFFFLNLMLAGRFAAPEFAAIPREQDEMLAAAWLKFAGYYVSLAKATGPMGALAAAIMTTAYVYGPPAVSASMRKAAQSSVIIKEPTQDEQPTPQMMN